VPRLFTPVPLTTNVHTQRIKSTDDRTEKCGKQKNKKLKKLNSVAVVRFERPPLVGEVSANLCGYRVLRGQRNEFPRPLISVFYTGKSAVKVKAKLSL
jgi:hypothetical protein